MNASLVAMKPMNPRRTGMVVAWVATLSLIVALGAQTADGQAPPRVPLAQDWSHRHLVYSAPATVEQALRFQNDPRYWHQWIQRHGAGAASIDAAARVLQDALLRRANNGHDTFPAGDSPGLMQLITSSPDEGVLPTLISSSPDEGVFSIHRDWGTSLAAGGTVGSGMSPAKFSFDVNATPSCPNDFVVFNTSVMSVASAASATGTFTGPPANGQTVTITSGANSETLTATGAPATGTVTIASGPTPLLDSVTVGTKTYRFVVALINPNDVLMVLGNTTKSATNLRAAIDASSAQCFSSPCFGAGTTANASVTATSNTNVVTVTAITWGAAGNTIALTSSDGLTIMVSGATLSGGVDPVNTGASFALGGTTSNIATNLAAAIIRNNNVGVTATSVGSMVTVTATAAGTAGNGTTLAESLSNFSWSGGSLSGGVDPQASIIAYNQLYSTQGSVGGLCNQNGPSVMWSYNTTAGGNTTGTTVSSPILSLDGTKVAYVETNSIANGGAVLHILKWKSGQGTAANAPVVPDQIVADWSSCTAGNSCIVNIPFNGGRPATISAPFYDYFGDALYVGDDNGVLHKVSPVLSGTPVEVTTSGWPITVNRGAVLAGPVFDSGSGNIFVGDGSGTLSYVRETTSMKGTCSSGSPPCLGTPSQTAGGAGVDAPLVDSSTGMVFAFDGTDGGNGTVYQIDTALSNGSIVAASVGGRGRGSAMFAGTFDNAYMSSVNGTGHLFVCGKDPGQTDRPAIHRITITNGVMNNSSDGSLTLVSGDQVECSSVTEVYNTAASTDWIFFSVGGSANQIAAGCSATAGITGCLMSLNLTALASWPPLKVTQGYRLPTAPANQGSTSEIIIDNVANTTTFQQASSLYFSFLNNAVTGATCNGATGVGCAVKLTQSALQ
jgi:hypothetical protein